MAENRDQTRQRSSGPSLRLYEYVLPGGKVRIQGVINNPPQPAPTYILFYFRGVGERRSIENGSAIFELSNLPPGEHQFRAVVPEAGTLSVEIRVTVPAGREALVADKLIVQSDGKDGHHTVYISIGTAEKTPVPGIHILIKDSFGSEVGSGITNERGVVHPHPCIEPKTVGIHHYRVYAEGTTLAPENLRLDGPPRYPKPPPVPTEISSEEQEYIGPNPLKALRAGFKAGRKALQEQREKRRQ